MKHTPVPWYTWEPNNKMVSVAARMGNISYTIAGVVGKNRRADSDLMALAPTLLTQRNTLLEACKIALQYASGTTNRDLQRILKAALSMCEEGAKQ